jgi:transposase
VRRILRSFAAPRRLRMTLALWIYATVDGVGSARKIAALCDIHLAYQWICGGVNVNHHSLSDFRKESADLLNDYLHRALRSCFRAG